MYRILLLDHSDLGARKIQNHIEAAAELYPEAPLQFTHVRRGDEADRLLAKDDFDLIISGEDLQELSAMQWAEAWLEKRSGGITPKVPVVMFVSEKTPHLVIAALDCGFSDVFSEADHETETMARTLNLMKWKRDRDALHEKNALLQEMSRLDALTQCASRRYLFEFMGQEIARQDRNQAPLALAMVAFDEEASLRKAVGEPRFDEALFRLAQALKELLRTQDFIARYEDGTLAIVLPQTDDAGAQTVGARVVAMVGTGEGLALPGGPGEAQFSVGVGIVWSNEAQPLRAWLEQASRTLSEAHQAGPSNFKWSRLDADAEGE